jgi:hypothetical protein
MRITKFVDRSVISRAIDSNTDPDILSRFVAIYYVRGVRKLIIHSKDALTKKQIEEVQKEINARCPGFEMVSQSNNELQLEDFTDMKEVAIDKVLRRLRSLIIQEFVEFNQGNYDAIKGIDELVGRFYMLGNRYINIVQPNEITNYSRILHFLKVISDNLLFATEDSGKNHINIIDKLKLMFELSESGFNGDQKSIVQLARLKKEIVKLIDNTKMENGYKRNLKEIARYSKHIGEAGLLHDNIVL